MSSGSSLKLARASLVLEFEDGRTWTFSAEEPMEAGFQLDRPLYCLQPPPGLWPPEPGMIDAYSMGGEVNGVTLRIGRNIGRQVRFGWDMPDTRGSASPPGVSS